VRRTLLHASRLLTPLRSPSPPAAGVGPSGREQIVLRAAVRQRQRVLQLNAMTSSPVSFVWLLLLLSLSSACAKLADGCARVYIDFGSNAGTQVSPSSAALPPSSLTSACADKKDV
jgi:hypothetical protein